MRELERDPPSDTPACTRLAIVGRGRVGTALARALRAGGATRFVITGPLGRSEATGPLDAVLLCVPDDQIARAAAAIAPGPLVGHCSGATSLDVLAPHEAFGLHPLMTVTAAGAQFAGAGAAVAGSTPRALGTAQALADALGLVTVRLAESDRPAYHAAASIASNFLLTLEGMAERLGATTGLTRAQLVPLVRATVENWASLGAHDALTGPVARGDEGTIARQRAAVAQRTPELLAAFDVLLAATRDLAGAAIPTGRAA
jgi:predicted short-subunit dehydrogenase-like oxidoreductase (DUF2520 family)